MNAGWSTSVTHNNYHCVPRRINFQSARRRKESQRAAMTDDNDADENLDK